MLHYALLPFAGRIGLLGLGTTAWLMAALVLMARADHFAAEAASAPNIPAALAAKSRVNPPARKDKAGWHGQLACPCSSHWLINAAECLPDPHKPTRIPPARELSLACHRYAIIPGHGNRMVWRMAIVALLLGGLCRRQEQEKPLPRLASSTDDFGLPLVITIEMPEVPPGDPGPIAPDQRGTGLSLGKMDILSWTQLLVASEWAIRLTMLPVIVLRKEKPATCLAWLAIVFFEPWIGLGLYLLIGENRLGRQRLARRHSRRPQLDASDYPQRRSPSRDRSRRGRVQRAGASGRAGRRAAGRGRQFALADVRHERGHRPADCRHRRRSAARPSAVLHLSRTTAWASAWPRRWSGRPSAA